jgi:hypothetical protein
MEMLANMQLQNRWRGTDLEQAVLDYIISGQPSSIRGSQFPTGVTYESMGLPSDFQAVPGPGPLLSAAFMEAARFGQGTDPLSQQREQSLGRLLSGESAFTADPELRERYFTEAIQRPTLQAFEREVLPSIAERFAGGGQTGAARRFTNTAITDLMTNLSGQRAGLLRQDEVLGAEMQSQALGRMLAGIQPSLQAQTTPISVMGQMGGWQRGITGQQRGEELMRAMLAQPWSDPRLGLYGAFLGNAPLAQLGSMGMQGLGGIISGAGGLAGQLGPLVY